MQRRTFVISVGSIAAAGGAALGTGAFDQIDAERTASIDVADDSDAIIELSEGDPSQFVGTDGGMLELRYEGSGNASGANRDATITIENAFTVGNNSTQDVGVKITHDGTDEAVNLTASDDTSVEEFPSANGESHNLAGYETDTQESFSVTIELDTSKSDLSSLSMITVTADPDAYATESTET